MKTDEGGETKSAFEPFKNQSYRPGVSTFAYRTYRYGDDETPGSFCARPRNIKKQFALLLVFHTFWGGGIPSYVSLGLLVAVVANSGANLLHLNLQVAVIHPQTYTVHALSITQSQASYFLC